MQNTVQQIRWPMGGSRSTARALLPWVMLIALVAGVAGVLGPSGAWSAESEIVARVNGEPVTRRELQSVLADRPMRRRMMAELGVQASDSRALERLALRKLINRSLILQEARQRGFTVPEQDLDRRVIVFRRRFKDAGRFAAWMNARGLDDKSLREALRTELLMARVRAAVVEGVRLMDEQVQEYYDEHKDELKTSEEVRVRSIAVKEKAAAEEILAALKKGEDFDRPAQGRSLESYAVQSSDTGLVDPQTLPVLLQEAIDTLKAGEIGGPVQTDAEFLVVRLDERRPARAKSLAEARPEIEQLLRRAKRDEIFQSWLKEQEKNAKIEVFLPDNSLAGVTSVEEIDRESFAE